ncbi:hypothetical protein ACAW74_18105 [Fibrella sp. WM1]|uniref:hypothetical protein n=1 Tax=Fibrella musci TaxID=3242485 RepID=UPI003520AB25
MPTKVKKTAAKPSKRKLTPKGRTYLDKLHTLTKSIHKASDTGETKVQKVYGLSWAQAEKQAIRKLKKK